MASIPPRRLVLAGSGHAHLAVLARWIKAPIADLETCLITPAPFMAYSGMMPGWMAGIYGPDECRIDIRPLVEKANIKLIAASVVGLDAAQRRLTLSNGETIGFDLLSIATGGALDVSPLAVLGASLLPVRPIEALVTRWPVITSQAAAQTSFSLAVVGGGAAGVELALAANRALRRVSPKAQISLIAGGKGFLAGHAVGVMARARAALIANQIALIQADAVGQAGGLLLSSGQKLAADCVIAATGSVAPAWLQASGLACDAQGFVQVGADLRSVSHPHIFAAGDIITRVDRHVARSGVHAVKAGPVLAANLQAAPCGKSLQNYHPKKRTLYLLATGDKRAILSWGRFSLSGRLVWRLKDWIDRRFVKHYRDLGGDGKAHQANPFQREPRA